MGITVSLPTDTKTPGTAGHTADHNQIVDAVTALAAAAANTAGDTFTGGVTLAASSPGTPASNKGVLYGSSSGTPTAKLDSSYAGAVALGSPADHTTHTSTSASSPSGIGICAAWTIPAGDAVAGTVYRLTAAGFGTWGSTQQALTANARIDAASAMVATTGSVAATALAISTAFHWRAVVELTVLTTGVSGTIDIYQELTVSAKAVAILPGTAASNTVTTLNSNSATGGTTVLDTTASHTLDIGAFWASTTGAPTITGTRSFLERLGA